MEDISIHTAYASGDDHCMYTKQYGVISIHTAYASGDGSEKKKVKDE